MKKNHHHKQQQQLHRLTKIRANQANFLFIKRKNLNKRLPKIMKKNLREVTLGSKVLCRRIILPPNQLYLLRQQPLNRHLRTNHLQINLQHIDHPWKINIPLIFLMKIQHNQQKCLILRNFQFPNLMNQIIPRIILLKRKLKTTATIVTTIRK